MIAEISAVLGVAKLAGEIAQSAAKISNDVERKEEVVKLLSVIQELQVKLITFGAQYEELAGIKRQLEAKVRDHENWEIEASRYESVETKMGTFVYRLKPTDPDYQEAKCLCATCFDTKKKSVLQRLHPKQRPHRCGRCQSVVLI